jgi:hypothetical protein
MLLEGFKNYLILENEQFLAVQIKNILEDLQNLQDEIESIGTRNLVRTSTVIANNIRNIVKSHWEISDKKALFSLQKCGVAILKSIEEKSDLKEIMPELVKETEAALVYLKEPVNKIASPSTKTAKEEPTPELPKSGDLSPENLPLTSGPQSIEKPPVGQMY